MRFSVLKAGTARPATLARLGDYGRMVTDLLSEEGETWVVHDAEKGVLPEDVSDWDGFVITGSRHSVHDPFPWIERLRECVRQVHLLRIPVVGFCFGHQLVADALGGRVGLNPTGWEIGVRAVRLTPQGKAAGEGIAVPDPIRILEIHREEVTELPPGSVLLAAGKRTRHEMFALGSSVLCIQGHPEFDREVVREAMEGLAAGGALAPREIQETLDSLAQEPDRLALRLLVRRFLERRVSEILP